MKKYRFGLLAVFLVLALLLAGCGPKLDQPQSGGTGPGTKTQAAEDFKIGMAISLSGGTAKYGKASQRGVEMAIEDFNASGGYQGRKAKLVIYDDEAKPEKSVEYVTRLLTQDKVAGIVGPANSGNALAHIHLVQEAGVPEVIPVATATAITEKYAKEPKNYIFRVSMVDSAQVTTMLNWMIEKKGFKKIGVMHDTTGYGQNGLKDVVAQMEKKGQKPAAVESFQIADTNMAPQLEKMKAARVDVIIVYTLAPEMAQILKSADKINYRPIFVGSWAFADPTVKELAGNLVNNNVYMVQSYTIDQSDKARAFHQRVIKKYGEDFFPIATAQGYDSAKMLLDAVKKVGPDPKKMRDAIEAFDDFEGVTAVPKKPFSKENHESLKSENMFLAKYKDGVIIKATD